VTSPQRAVPFYCPYCGEEDLRPHGDSHGGWWCAACRRAWNLRYIGTGTPDADLVAADPPGSDTVPPERGGVVPR